MFWIRNRGVNIRTFTSYLFSDAASDRNRATTNYINSLRNVGNVNHNANLLVHRRLLVAEDGLLYPLLIQNRIRLNLGIG